ncbi:hypothetical protein GYMLUDRAFT_43009 [Collybiopsis luxurians FD-317 M1]|uniref:Nucleotide exchange factor Fes1 domain-containing protein n=1 Tax=Collybiopsis luxurians FD-317 M1 TaxID=944289 RepID=A0A0D0CFS7_9AGAR|nr:hypothetical protein GYMLUDRAFT_43009 [Collybiopsis luxurians FD-317 M1]
MQSLLRWGIENSTPLNTENGAAAAAASQPPRPRSDLNPEIIDMLLGKSDAEQMKEAMDIAVDSSRSEDDRVDALDNLEMLIEQIDNANNLEKLKMWEPLHALLTSTPDAVATHAIWVIGTALQNNPAAQDAYLKLNPIPTLTSFLAPNPSSTSSSAQRIRSKVIYALSGLLKHNAPALVRMEEDGSEGWSRLREALQDPDITVRRKTAFLLNSLLTPNESAPAPAASSSSAPDNFHTPNSHHAPPPIHANSHAAHLSDANRASTSALTLEAMHKHDILDTLIRGLTDPVPYGADGDQEEVDGDFEEKGVALLRTYLNLCEGPLDRKQKDRIREWIGREKAKSIGSSSSSGGGGGDSSSGAENGTNSLAERWGMSYAEFVEFASRVE